MRSERFALMMATVVVVAVSTIPTIVGYLHAPQGWSFTGILSRNTADFNGYMSMAEEIRRDGLLARNLFTAEPQPHFQLRPLYALLGVLGRILPFVSTLTLIEVGRLLSCSALLAILILIIRRVFARSRDRLFAFLVMSAGSGLGWTHGVADPPDLRIVETSTFLSLISPLLYTVSLSLVLAILFAVSRAWESANKSTAVRFAVLAGILGLWLGLDRPFSFASLSVAIAGGLVLDWIQQRRFPARNFLLCLPVIFGAGAAFAYQYWARSHIAVYAEWNRQHVLPTPEMVRLLFSLGLLVPLALIGLRPVLTAAPGLGGLFCFYMVGSLVCSHLPIQFQERFLEGLPACTGLLAAGGLVTILHGVKRPEQATLFAILAVILLIPSNIVAMRIDLAVLSHPMPPQYLPNEVLAGMRKIADLAAPEEAVLCSQASGNFIPAYAARPVVLGHPIQTARVADKQILVARLFRLQANDPQALELIRLSRAQWIFWGPEERWLARGEFDPSAAPFLKQEYSNRSVAIYRVLH